MTPPVEAPMTPPVEAPMTPPVEAPMTPPVEAPMTPPVEAPMESPEYQWCLDAELGLGNNDTNFTEGEMEECKQFICDNVIPDDGTVAASAAVKNDAITKLLRGNQFKCVLVDYDPENPIEFQVIGTPEADKKDDKLSGGAIAGIVIGSVSLVGIIVGYMYWKKASLAAGTYENVN
ncbi:hypothetical protein DIPPA_11759 [Diplonema papillatum]|nr:hypothetical protein DIPPA_11759 [Diplonema papillatum]